MYLGQADASAPWCTQCYASTNLYPGDPGYVDTEDPCDMASTAYSPTICQAGAGGTSGGTSTGTGSGPGSSISSIINSVLNTIVPPLQRATGTGPYTPPPTSTGFFGTASAGGMSSLLIIGLVLGGAYFLSKGGK